MRGYLAIYNSRDTTTPTPTTTTFRAMSNFLEKNIDQTGLSNVGEVDVSAEFIPIHITTTGSIAAVIGIIVGLAIMWQFCKKKNLKQIKQLCCHKCEPRKDDYPMHQRPYGVSGETTRQIQSVENLIREANLRVMEAMTPQRVIEQIQPAADVV